MHLDWDWTNFSVVIAGSAEWQPTFNRVRFNHFAEMSILVGHLLKAGKQRMGLVIDESLEQRSLHAIDGGFWAAVPAAVRKEEAIFKPMGRGRKALMDWMQAYEPDSLIAGSPEILKWIESIGTSPPIFMRSLERPPSEAQPPGMRQDFERLGQAAAEQLLAQFQINQTGVPSNPLQTLITGRWEDSEKQ